MKLLTAMKFQYITTTAFQYITTVEQKKKWIYIKEEITAFLGI